jgi:hypothetical protein
VPGNTTTLLLRSRGALEITHGHVSPLVRRAASVFASQWQSAAYRTPLADAATLWSVAVDSENDGLYVRSQGGAAVFTGLASSARPLDAPISLGAGDDGTAPFRVRIGELLAYERVLHPEERVGVTTALRQKWGFVEPACATDAVLGPDGGCYFVVAAASTWDDAATSCQNRGLGWDLLGIRSALENEFAAALIDVDVWTSGSSTGSGDQWAWQEDGYPFWLGTDGGAAENDAYENWASGEPVAMEGCVLLRPSGAWEAVACDESHPAVCRGPGN